jgi:hypothetical protein
MFRLRRQREGPRRALVLHEGQRVRIVEGPLSGLCGLLLRRTLTGWALELDQFPGIRIVLQDDFVEPEYW